MKNEHIFLEENNIRKGFRIRVFHRMLSEWDIFQERCSIANYSISYLFLNFFMTSVLSEINSDDARAGDLRHRIELIISGISIDTINVRQRHVYRSPAFAT